MLNRVSFFTLNIMLSILSNRPDTDYRLNVFRVDGFYYPDILINVKRFRFNNISFNCARDRYCAFICFMPIITHLSKRTKYD